MWLDANHATCSYARRHRKPYVITPHGMLYPQALAISPTRKKWMRRLLFDRDLSKAACIHATCRQEAEHIRALGIKTPIAVIANPIRISDTLDEAMVSKLREEGYSDDELKDIIENPGKPEALHKLAMRNADAITLPAAAPAELLEFAQELNKPLLIMQPAQVFQKYDTEAFSKFYASLKEK